MPKKVSSISTSLCLYGAIIAAFVLYNSMLHPFYNWDLAPYIGSVLSLDLDDAYTIHNKTYQILQQSIPDAAFRQFTMGAYQAATYSSPEIFHEQLNFYYIKPLYILMIYALSHLGMTIVDAIAMISLVATLFSAGLTLYWISCHTNSHLGFILTLLVGFQARLFDLGRIATPDALSVALILLALFLLFEKRLIKTASMLFACSILVRSNNIIFATLFISYITFYWHQKRDMKAVKFSGALLILTIATYLVLTSALHGYSWWTLFYHSFVTTLNYPSQFNVPFSISTYLQVIIEQLKTLFIPSLSSPSTMIIFVFILGLSCLEAFNNSKYSYKEPCIAICAMIFINYGAHFILFPGVIQWDRFFTSFYVFSAIMLIAKLKNRESFNL